MSLITTPIPEPGAFAFAALGVGALLFMRKFRR
jgi:MYXO-CTERM domain-containing protein